MACIICKNLIVNKNKVCCLDFARNTLFLNIYFGFRMIDSMIYGSILTQNSELMWNRRSCRPLLRHPLSLDRRFRILSHLLHKLKSLEESGKNWSPICVPTPVTKNLRLGLLLFRHSGTSAKNWTLQCYRKSWRIRSWWGLLITLTPLSLSRDPANLLWRLF